MYLTFLSSLRQVVIDVAYSSWTNYTEWRLDEGEMRTWVASDVIFGTTSIDVSINLSRYNNDPSYDCFRAIFVIATVSVEPTT